MKVTKVYTELLEAVVEGYRYIESRGSSRSSKTFSGLQLLKTISDVSNKKELNTIVSHSLPHLKGGAIRDFDNILEAEGIDVDSIRTQNPYIYQLGKQTIEFIGFDKPGKALGAARDRLYINEANKMPFSIAHQLMQRTTGLIMYDYNPSHEFWAQTEGYSLKKDCKVIRSTFLDNIQNLTQGQVDDFLMAKNKHDEEVARGVKGYWFNWWRVYGLGLDGIVEGAIFTNWEYGKFDESIPSAYGLDFGSRDPDAMVRVAVDHANKRIYAKEEIYKNNLSTDELISLIKTRNTGDRLILCDSANTRTITDISNAGINAQAVKKPGIIESIKVLQGYQLIIDPDSINLVMELSNYIWLDKKGEIPIDQYNHLIDAFRYIAFTLTAKIRRRKTKVARRN